MNNLLVKVFGLYKDMTKKKVVRSVTVRMEQRMQNLTRRA
jgi:hypothetical protein